MDCSSGGSASTAGGSDSNKAPTSANTAKIKSQQQQQQRKYGGYGGGGKGCAPIAPPGSLTGSLPHPGNMMRAAGAANKNNNPNSSSLHNNNNNNNASIKAHPGRKRGTAVKKNAMQSPEGFMVPSGQQQHHYRQMITPQGIYIYIHVYVCIRLH